MKKLTMLLVLGLFVLLVGAAQPAQAALSSALVWGTVDLADEAAQLNAATGKFEGLLNAYSTKPPHPDFIWIPVQVDKNIRSAAGDLSSSLEEFNAALLEIYPTLTEEEQLAVGEAYSSLGLYLENLAAETNSVFGKKVFQVEYSESSIDSFDFLDPKSFMEPLE